MPPKGNIHRILSSIPARARIVLLVLILLLIVNLRPASPASAAAAVTISWNDVHQTIDGFGGSGAFGQANSLKNMSEPARTTILDALFSQTSGAGLSIVRNIINDGSSGTTIEPSLNNWVWTGDADQIWLMQQALARGTTRFISTVWSPPGWMKDNGSAVGGSLAPAHYQDFADYLSRYVREYNSRFGLTIQVVSLANEPRANVSYSSCHWTGVQFHDFIKNNLLPTFQADGVPVLVMIPEDAYWDETFANESLADPVTAARVDLVGGHHYHATIPSTVAPFSNSLAHNKKVWQTETSLLTNPNDSSITDGLKWATEVHNFMVTDSSAYLYWWLIEGDRSDSEALVQLNRSNNTYTLNKRLYTMGNYARFVRPDFVRIGATESPAANVLTTAYRDPASNKFILVAVNNTASSQTIDIVPDGFSASSLTPYVTDATRNLVQLPDVSLSGVSLAPSSVTTFVGTATTIPPTCYALTLSHTGNGSDPTASPTNSPSCTTDHYIAGASISLSGAIPSSGSKIISWSGTRNDISTASTNSLTMPADDHTASVFYSKVYSDFDGDGKSDPVKYDASAHIVSWLKSSDGSWGSADMSTDTFTYVPRSDFDGDGKTDPAKFVPAVGAVWYLKSSTGTWEGQFVGSDSYTYVSGSDYDGDGKTDPAKFVSSVNALWYLQSSTSTWQGVYMGPGSFTLVNGSDFDGDGKTDPALFVSSVNALWYMKSSTGTWQGVYMGPGSYSMVPVSDFDGDGKTDPAHFDTSTQVLWYLQSSTSTWQGVYMGTGTYSYVAGCDFDGDGKTDPAKFDPATHVLWYLQSSTGTWQGVWMGDGTYDVVN